MDDQKLNLCPNFKQCSTGLWRGFKTSAKKVWINHYCTGPKKADCVRRVLRRHGQTVPSSLLPNGESLLVSEILSGKTDD